MNNKTIKITENQLTHIIKKYLVEINNMPEEAVELIDIISLNPNNTRYDKYRDMLINKYNINFDDVYKDEIYIKNASLNNIKNKNDFLNFDNYVKYAKIIFKLRNIPSEKEIYKEVDSSVVKQIGERLNFKVEIKEYAGTGNYASHDLVDTITIPNVVDVSTLIHEMGHHFDHHYSNEYEGLAKTITYASSHYHIDKSNEVFAENFMHFFIKPNIIKKYLPEVYNELNQNIPDIWKNEIKKITK